jgi:hypothetical protein
MLLGDLGAEVIGSKRDGVWLEPHSLTAIGAGFIADLFRIRQ